MNIKTKISFCLKTVTALFLALFLAACSGDSGPSSSDIKNLLNEALERKGIDAISTAEVDILETKTSDNEDVYGVKFNASFTLQKDYDALDYNEQRHVRRIFNGKESKKGDEVTEEMQTVFTKKDGEWVGKL